MRITAGMIQVGDEVLMSDRDPNFGVVTRVQINNERVIVTCESDDDEIWDTYYHPMFEVDVIPALHSRSTLTLS